MAKSVLILDDEQVQAENLQKSLQKEMKEYSFSCAYEEKDMLEKIESVYYNVAIVDLRMDKYEIDGFKLMELIAIYNPFAKIIVISAFTQEYYETLKKYLTKGQILAISEKKVWEEWIPELTSVLKDYLSPSLDTIAQNALEDMYEQAKNATTAYEKGLKFENFVAVLFGRMGFEHIKARIRDEASNEKDLIIRNDIKDIFFEKYKPYFYVECKNRNEGFDKNDFTAFYEKIHMSHGVSNLGFVFTTSYVKDTVYKQALVEAKGNIKIVYIATDLIVRLIHAQNILEEFKDIIDEQVN